MGRDTITGLAVLAASLGLFWATLGLERNSLVPVGPGFYPRLVLGATAAFALALVVVDVARRRRHAPAAEAAPRNHALVAAAFGIFGAYVLALPWLGFRVSTFLFLLAMPAALEHPPARHRAMVLALAVAATAIVWFVFESYLHVLLPRGRWTGF